MVTSADVEGVDAGSYTSVTGLPGNDSLPKLSLINPRHKIQATPQRGLDVDKGRVEQALRDFSHERTELYDPSTATFTPSGILTSSRSLHTATLLPGGWVLVAGGDGTSCFGNTCYSQPSLASAELYDPVSGAFGSAGNMTAGRSRSHRYPAEYRQSSDRRGRS
jgi:hypothetical protein